LNAIASPIVVRSLRAVRRQMLVQTFLVRLSRWLLMGSAVLLVAGAGRWWLTAQTPFDREWLLAALVVAVLGATVSTLVSWPKLDAVAKLTDRLGGTRDRFVTAMTFSQATSGLEAAALRECGEFIGRSDFRRLLSLRIPRESAWLLAPAVALALLALHSGAALQHQAELRAQAQEEIAGTVEQLEELARETEKKSDETQSEELKRIAEQLKQSAQDLQANATDAEQAAKAALRELSALEQMIKEAQDAAGSATPEELQELAKALAENAATKDAAAALEAGRTEEAAEKLEEAAAQDPEATQKALQEALQRLAEKRELSEQIRQLAQQSKQAGGASSEALQKLAELLRKMPPQQGQQSQASSNSSPSKQSLQDLLAALQNMKFGEPPQGPPKGSSPGDGEQMSPTLVQSFSQGEGEPMPGDADVPSGLPGGERDTGTTASAFTDDAGERAEEGAGQQLAGRLGEGETLQQFLPSAGDTSKSQRRYKEIYEAMAPAAEAAVVQENIPLGSRFMIKRYFEAIRPAE
jgi:hypothetical protein